MKQPFSLFPGGCVVQLDIVIDPAANKKRKKKKSSLQLRVSFFIFTVSGCVTDLQTCRGDQHDPSECFRTFQYLNLAHVDLLEPVGVYVTMDRLCNQTRQLDYIDCTYQSPDQKLHRDTQTEAIRKRKRKNVLKAPSLDGTIDSRLLLTAAYSHGRVNCALSLSLSFSIYK